MSKKLKFTPISSPTPTNLCTTYTWVSQPRTQALISAHPSIGLVPSLLFPVRSFWWRHRIGITKGLAENDPSWSCLCSILGGRFSTRPPISFPPSGKTIGNEIVRPLTILLAQAILKEMPGNETILPSWHGSEVDSGTSWHPRWLS